MKIRREVNGQSMEFELTPRELHQAFKEHEHNNDIQTVKSHLERFNSPSGIQEFYIKFNVAFHSVFNDSESISQIASEMRRGIDKFKISPDYALASAINDTCRYIKSIATKGDKFTNYFVFDDELCVQDEKYECVDGYLWATDPLVKKLQKQQGPDWSPDDVDNINFYSIYNLKDQTIEVLGTYWHYPPEQNPFNEKQEQFVLELTPEESNELIATMDYYCCARYGMDCLEFVNTERLDHNLAILSNPSAEKLSLSSIIETASMKALNQHSQEAPKGVER